MSSCACGSGWERGRAFPRALEENVACVSLHMEHGTLGLSLFIMAPVGRHFGAGNVEAVGIGEILGWSCTDRPGEG